MRVIDFKVLVLFKGFFTLSKLPYSYLLLSDMFLF